MEGRRMTKRIIGNLTILAALLAFSAGASAQDAKLVDAAKAEGGKVVVYGSRENETMVLGAAGVNTKTGVTVEFFRAASTKVMDRAQGEFLPGKPLFDTVLM